MIFRLSDIDKQYCRSFCRAKHVTTSYFTLRSLSIKVFSLLTEKGNSAESCSA